MQISDAGKSGSISFELWLSKRKSEREDQAVCGAISIEKEKGRFPQEAGIFLGYSFEDVEGFAGISGKECMMTGYWKVYGHRAEKEMLFMIYDQVKMWAVNEFLAGKTAGEICR